MMPIKFLGFGTGQSITKKMVTDTTRNQVLLSLFALSSASLYLYNCVSDFYMQQQQQINKVEKLYQEARSYGIFTKKISEESCFTTSAILSGIGLAPPSSNTERIAELEELVLEQRNLHIQWKDIQEQMLRYGIEIPSTLQTVYLEETQKNKRKVRLNASILEEQKDILECHQNFPVLCKHQFEPVCVDVIISHVGFSL